MENNANLKKTKYTKVGKFSVYFIALSSLLFCNNVSAGLHFYNVRQHNADTTDEKKVDYIEKIYFSGGNKDELNTMIVSTIQDLDGKPATKAVAKQYVFLNGIRGNAEAASSTCEIEQILAVGIYNLDANECRKQHIPKSNSQANNSAATALANISNLTNDTKNLSTDVIYVKQGSAYSSYVAAAKVNIITSKVNVAADAVNKGKKIFSGFRHLVSDDNGPCNQVPKKDIEIGLHILPDTSKKAIQTVAITTITIKNINYEQLTSVKSSIKKITGINSANIGGFNNNMATILISSNMATEDIIGKILQSNTGIKLNIESFTANTATLSIH
jgi:hypothetical protein